jgi:hypothetical protein
MKTIALIPLCLLALWWGLLTVHVFFLHRERIRFAATWTPEHEKAQQRMLEQNNSNRADARKHLADYAMMSSLAFLFCRFVSITSWSNTNNDQ